MSVGVFGQREFGIYLLVDLNVDHDTLFGLALEEAVKAPFGVVCARATKLAMSAMTDKFNAPEVRGTATSRES